MINLSTLNADQWSIPFGVVIGPCTVLSNAVKLINDAASIVFQSMAIYNTSPSKHYLQLQQANLRWEAEISKTSKPTYNQNGVSWSPANLKQPVIKKGISLLGEIHGYYCLVSPDDKKRMLIDQLKQNAIHHLTFIGIGIIRSIPLMGGIMLCHYPIKSK